MATTTTTRPPSVADGKKGRRLRRRRRIWPFVLGGVLLVALLAAGVWLVWFSSVLAAQQVQVTGLKTLNKGEVTARPRCSWAYRWRVRTSPVSPIGSPSSPRSNM